jgi:hypothetical protein
VDLYLQSSRGVYGDNFTFVSTYIGDLKSWGGVLEVAQLVEALRYKPERRGFDSRRCHLNFHWHNPSGRTNRNDYQEYFLGVKAAGA